MSRTRKVRVSFSWPTQLALQKPGSIAGFEQTAAHLASNGEDVSQSTSDEATSQVIVPIGGGPSRGFKTVSHPLSVPLAHRLAPPEDLLLKRQNGSPKSTLSC
jgi:hypothetical protein